MNRQEEILNVLLNAHRPLTTLAVGKYTGFAYNTVKKNLNLLLEKDLVLCDRQTNRIYWEANLSNQYFRSS